MSSLKRFVRGDCQQDGAVDITDVVFSLEFAFLGGREPSCLAACDFDATGSIDVTNALGLLGALYGGGSPLPAPYPSCGPATLEDEALGCAAPPVACDAAF